MQLIGQALEEAGVNADDEGKTEVNTLLQKTTVLIQMKQ